jgi:hypothetical protein
MSLSTQIHRGTLALPMLLLFALLALVANEELPAPELPAAPTPVHEVSMVPAATASIACSLPRPGLLLGHAPGDLAALSPRATACRAASAS